MSSSQEQREPFVVCTYGPSGIGKTTDMGYSFPRAIFVAAPGALSSIEHVCGYTTRPAQVADIEECAKLIVEIGKSKKADTVVVDDFSFLAEQTFSRLESKITGFKLWGKMRDIALDFRDQSRYAGVNVVLNAWEQGPKTREDGTRVRGGPQLSGKLPESIPALCDVVYRAVHERSRKPWPAVYRCSNDPSFVMKDRFDVGRICDPAPMNLAELLRASGHVVARHPDLPNQETQVEAISKLFSGDTTADIPAANEVFRKLIDSGVPQKAARWTIRDAIDRAVIRRDLSANALTFFDLSSNNFLGA